MATQMEPVSTKNGQSNGRPRVTVAEANEELEPEPGEQRPLQQGVRGRVVGGERLHRFQGNQGERG
jgi:hypothetical protein